MNNKILNLLAIIAFTVTSIIIINFSVLVEDQSPKNRSEYFRAINITLPVFVAMLSLTTATAIYLRSYKESVKKEEEKQKKEFEKNKLNPEIKYTIIYIKSQDSEPKIITTNKNLSQAKIDQISNLISNYLEENND